MCSIFIGVAIFLFSFGDNPNNYVLQMFLIYIYLSIYRLHTSYIHTVHMYRILILLFRVCAFVSVCNKNFRKLDIVEPCFFHQHGELCLGSCANCFSSWYNPWFEPKGLWSFFRDNAWNHTLHITTVQYSAILKKLVVFSWGEVTNGLGMDNKLAGERFEQFPPLVGMQQGRRAS